MATGIAFPNTREIEWLNYNLRGSAMPAAPTALYLGLFGAAPWQASTAYALNAFVCDSNDTANTRLYKCTTAGTSGAADPFAAGNTDGQVITDNTVTWTEQTLAMEAIADGAAWPGELSGSGYARLNLGLTAMTAAAAIGGTSTGSRSQNAAQLTFPSATANWVRVLGFLWSTAATLGNYRAYGRMSSQLQVNSGQAVIFQAAALTLTVD